MNYSDVGFQYCPYCYEDYPPDAEMLGSFCPFCGKSLLDYMEEDALEEDAPDVQEETATLPDASAAASLQAPAIKKKKKAAPAVDEEYHYYSVILKDCPNKDSLAKRLARVFVRDAFALELALKNLPSVIVYKGNVADMEAVIRAFLAENAAISVIAGDFNIYATIYEQYPILYKQPADIQHIFSSVPTQLWLGDKIHIAVHAVRQEIEGMLVVTDQGLYFLDSLGDMGGSSWVIVPYYQVLEITSFTDETGSGLLVRREFKREGTSAAIEFERFYISDIDQIKRASDLALLSLEAGNYRQRLLLWCQNCTYRRVEVLDGGNLDDCCPVCGGQIRLSLLVRNKI